MASELRHEMLEVSRADISKCQKRIGCADNFADATTNVVPGVRLEPPLPVPMTALLPLPQETPVAYQNSGSCRSQVP